MVNINTTRARYKEKLPLIVAGIVNDFVNVLVRTCPVDTGNLKNQIGYRKNPNGYEIFMPYYSLYLEYGTMAHYIKPVKAKALSWTSGKNGGGTRYFSKGHFVSGIEPQPFIRYAARRHLKEIIVKNFVRHLA